MIRKREAAHLMTSYQRLRQGHVARGLGSSPATFRQLWAYMRSATIGPLKLAACYDYVIGMRRFHRTLKVPVTTSQVSTIA